MDILRNTILLAFLCLFSSALIGADKVAEQLVSDYQKQIDNAKSTVISKLKARQEALANAGKVEEAKEVEGMIIELQGGTDVSKDLVGYSGKTTDEVNLKLEKAYNELISDLEKLYSKKSNMDNNMYYAEVDKKLKKYEKNYAKLSDKLDEVSRNVNLLKLYTELYGKNIIRNEPREAKESEISKNLLEILKKSDKPLEECTKLFEDLYNQKLIGNRTRQYVIQELTKSKDGK